MSLFRELNNCLCCLFKTEILLDLEYQPLANNFHELNEKEENFPLKMLFCLKIQSSILFLPQELQIRDLQVCGIIFLVLHLGLEHSYW